MEFRIADTFTDSLARLTGDEQKAVKTTAFDLQLNPANPGMSFHKLDRAKDKNFWSLRVSADIRIIVHRSARSLLLCYVDHHDKAYTWAERRKLEVHPTTGAAQLVEIRETVKEIVVPVYTQPKQRVEGTAPRDQTPMFGALSNDELLSYGVPLEWLNDVRIATEASLLGLIDHLPAEASEALLELATGGKPRRAGESILELALGAPAEADRLADSVAMVRQATTQPFEHPDAQRRFRKIESLEELQRALEYPWDKWTIFLHPDQREWVQRDFAGPAKVAGSAGTGKTIVALHRAVHLARANPNGRVLLTTFSDSLAHALQVRTRRLLAGEPRLAERLDVATLLEVGRRLYKSHIGPVVTAEPAVVHALIQEAAAAAPGHRFGMPFLVSEWEQVVDPWQLDSWGAYRDVARLGRKTRLSEVQRKLLWTIFERVRAELAGRKVITEGQLFTSVASVVQSGRKVIYDYVVADEAQDLGVPQLRFLAALAGDRPNGLFLAGDLGQRIFQQPFSWKSLGVEVRGRSRTLRVNYRTSHQIRSQADRLLARELTDVDGNIEERGDTISAFNGSPPTIRSYASESEEIDAVGKWLAEQTSSGVVPHEIGVFVRSAAQLERAQKTVTRSGMPFKVLDEHVETTSGYASISTMHLAKGLEFRAVAVMACDDEVIPLQERIEAVGDDADLQEVYDTERHLLYVACTRARDLLLVTSVAPGSEFLDDLRGT
jgi:mRNA-degrading endonuclease RelE of RelBE toxin-antitoxin system